MCHYRVHQGLPVFNKMMDPIELSETQRTDFLLQPFEDKLEGFTFPEDLLPSCARVDSTIPLLKMVNCLTELLRDGGSYIFLRKLWCCFRATLGRNNPLSSRTESLVSICEVVSFSFSQSSLLSFSLLRLFLFSNAGVEYWLGLGGVNRMHPIDWSCVLFQALVCRALFPRVLRTLLSRMSASKEYLVRFEAFGGERL